MRPALLALLLGLGACAQPQTTVVPDWYNWNVHGPWPQPGDPIPSGHPAASQYVPSYIDPSQPAYWSRGPAYYPTYARRPAGLPAWYHVRQARIESRGWRR